MTRDIIDINDFIVLIESSYEDEETVDICSFNEEVIGISFYGSGNVELSANFGDNEEISAHTKGLSLSFFSNDKVDFKHTVSGDIPLQCVVIVASLKNIRKLPNDEKDSFAHIDFI